MQSSRVWQTQFREDGVAPQEELPSINYDLVRKSMRQMGAQVAPPKTDVDPAGIGGLVREAMTPMKPEFRPDASQWVPESPKRRLKLASEQTPKAEMSETCEECGIPHPCHHDVEAARKAGDMEAVKAMNEVRNMRRVAFVQAQEQVMQMEEEQSFIKEASARQERRIAVAEILDEMEKELVAESEEEEETGEKDGFKPVSSLNSSERDRLVKWANKHGWDPEYAEKFFSSSDDEIPEAIRKVGATSLDEASKRGIITSMLKESSLSSEQANRIKKYWKEELQYQDAGWVDDMVAEPDK